MRNFSVFMLLTVITIFIMTFANDNNVLIMFFVIILRVFYLIYLI